MCVPKRLWLAGMTAVLMLAGGIHAKADASADSKGTDWFGAGGSSDALTTGISSDCSVLPESAANSGRAGYKTSRPMAIMNRFLTVEYTRCIFMVAQNPFIPCVGSL